MSNSSISFCLSVSQCSEKAAWTMPHIKPMFALNNAVQSSKLHDVLLSTMNQVLPAHLEALCVRA
jgi:hypothetical protein